MGMFKHTRSMARPWVKEYLSAMASLPTIFKHIAFRRRTLAEELQEALLRGSLRKAFSGFDLMMLGLGIVIASGWTQLSGFAAEQYAGPAVVLSYLWSGITALLAACCFAELCVAFPVAGGAFSYVMATFGELPAFVTLASLLLQYALGMAAVARGFSRYLARLCNLDPTIFVKEIDDSHFFDFMAAGVVMLMSVLLSMGVRESAWFISTLTVVKLVLLLFISIVGYANGAWDANAQPFIDPNFGADGIFLGAACLFFTYVGFDAICNTAEEARNVAYLPWALVGTPLVAGALYLMLAFSLVVIAVPNPWAAVPPEQGGAPFGPYAGVSYAALTYCDGEPPGSLSFITAFVSLQDMKWMQYVVALASLLGILTALTVGLFSASRIVMAAARDWLLPPCLARISPRTQTPLLVQMVLGVIIALLAMLVDVEMATSVVSFGTLMALWLVCNAQIYRRYFPNVQMRFTRYGTVEVEGGKAEEVARPPTWVLSRRLPLYWHKALVWGHLAVINLVAWFFGGYYAASTNEMVNHENHDMWEPGHYVCYTPFAGGGVVWNGTVAYDTAYATNVPTNYTTACGCGNGTGAPVVNPSMQAQQEGALGHSSLASVWFVVGWALATASLQATCELEYHPEGWHIPWYLMPWLPSAAIIATLFTTGALPNGDYWKVATYFGAILLFYLLFSLPISYIKHSRVDYFNTDELKVVELVLQDGEWRAARHNPMTLVSTPSAPSVHISSTSTTATLGRPSAELGPRGSYEAQQLSGRLPTVGSVRSGRYVARPGSALPVMREDGEAAA